MKKKQSKQSGFFWKTGKNLKKITILNPDDFKIPGIINSDVDRNDYGLADLEEISERNEITSFLFRNKSIREKIIAWQNLDTKYRELPSDQNYFMDFYTKKDNLYWKMVDEIICEFEKHDDLPNRFKAFLDAIKRAKENLELMEKSMSKRMIAQLSKATKFDGIAEINVHKRFINHDNSELIGEKAWSANWSPSYIAPIKSFWKTKLCRFLGLRKLVQNIANKVAGIKAKKSSLLTYFPQSIIDDICDGLRLSMNTIKSSSKSYLLEKEKKEELLSNKFDLLKETFIGVKFYYNSNGLHVTPNYFRTSNDTDGCESHFNNSYKNWEYEKEFSVQRRLFDEKSLTALQLKNSQNLLDFYQKNTLFKIGQVVKFESSGTDRNFRWSFLSNVYNHKDNVNTYNKLLSQRRFVFYALSELTKIISTIESFENHAAACSLDLCVPSIRKSGTGVRFENLAPIDMMNQNKKMIPFSFPRINGHMVCLTGRHGRGKSVSGNSILQNMYLAQSGLPVFAKSFEFDVKDVIGAVVNDNGKGSTATVFIEKTKNLFKNISKVPAEKSLIFIDEIGKGTQESAGIYLGKIILESINKNGYSAIFNTQILELAKFAQENYGAICLKVNKNHQFTVGIGEGEMDKLIKETHLERYLK